MTSDRLAKSYLEKAAVRLKMLYFLHGEKGYSDVVREAQECVELLLKALLRHMGLEVPKTHDVSRVLRDNQKSLPQEVASNLDELTEISRTLRKDRELSYYGSEDWIPTEEYSETDSNEAIAKVKTVFGVVSKVFKSP